MLRRVLSMQERGIKVLGLHVGEPKIAASKAIRDLVRDAMAKAPIVYTATVGTTELRAKIAEVASEVLNRDVADEETLVAVGAKQALHLALASLIAPGDEVLVISPAWGSFVETVQLAGGKPVHVHADPEAIAQAITRRTRAIIVNSPNNPTGEVYSQAKIEALLKPCNDAGLWLISDELYRAYAFDAPHVSAASLYDETRTVWLDGVAKSHAMTGLRIGYAVAPRALIGKMAKLASHETSCASSVTQAAATALLTAHPHGDTQLIAQIKALRSKVHATLGDRLGAPMQGAFYAWLKVGPDSRRICDRLLTEHHVATMFGEAFGARGFLRLSYAIDASSLERALLRVKNAL